MTFTQKTSLFGFGLLAAVLFVYVLGLSTQKAYGSAPSGLPAAIATSSTAAVSSTASLVFATSTCSARIISTGVNGIMITLSDKQGLVPSGTVGHWQGASTTVAYDSGQYGCGAFRVYSSVSQTINVSESQ